MSFPVHFISWGSGQNALYAYLSMPFIAVFGLDVFSVRIVNLIFSLITVVAVYFMIKTFKNKKTAFIAMALTAASPWNIMLARWGLESNLFPAFFVLSLWALLLSTKKAHFVYLAAVLMALSLYSYGAAYLVISIFGFICFFYFLFARLVKARYGVLYFKYSQI